MSFNYEQSIWGRGEASLRWSDPTAFRLRQSLVALEDLPSESKVMEIGCGAGQFIRAIKKYRPDLHCLGSDISETAIEVARKIERNRKLDHVIAWKGEEVSVPPIVEYTLSSQNKLPYVDSSLNAVLIFDVLEHVENPPAIVKEVCRVLKPGGIFYAFVPCEGDVTSLWNWLNKISLKKDLTKKHAGHINYFSRKSLIKLFTELDFKIIKLRYSEHILGQMLGILAFYLMERATKRERLTQINNEAYFTRNDSGILRKIKNIVNALVYFESWLLQKLPSPNMHAVLQKMK